MMEDEEFDAVIDTNLKGCFNMIKACSRNFIKKKYGKNALVKGMNLEEGATAMDRNAQIGGHKA